MLISAAILSLNIVGQSLSANIGRADERMRLEACIARLEDDPEGAYEDGLAWTNEGNRPLARQCTALALIALGHAAEGAARLETLANAENAGGVRQRVIFLTQAGNAWILAGAFEAALVTLDNAIRLSPYDPELKVDRAAALVELERWSEAVEDLDAIQNQLPLNKDILKLRAEAHLNLENFEQAEQDINAAMHLDLQDVQTLVLRGRIREAKRLAEDTEDDTLLLIGE